MTNFIIVGCGWRAEFYYRIAELLPDRFCVSAAVLRTAKRAEEVRAAKGIYTTDCLREALKKEHDFTVLSVAKGASMPLLEELIKAGEPVLCETPPALDVEALNYLWELKERYQGRVQVCEQYLCQPLYAACLALIRQGLLGTVSNMTLSALHDYHAASIFRHFLNTGYENCTISGRTYTSDVTRTNSRAGFDYSGSVISMTRMMASLDFDNGTSAFYDFSGEQYHSRIRTRRMNVQGIRGEINDLTVRYLTQEQHLVTMNLERIDKGVYNNNGWSHHGIMLGERLLYQNPFPDARLNDDELAIASCLAGMKEYVACDKEIYSLRDALQDTYLALQMKKACESPGTLVRTESQSWC